MFVEKKQNLGTTSDCVMTSCANVIKMQCSVSAEICLVCENDFFSPFLCVFLKGLSHDCLEVEADLTAVNQKPRLSLLPECLWIEWNSRFSVEVQVLPGADFISQQAQWVCLGDQAAAGLWVPSRPWQPIGNGKWVT